MKKLFACLLICLFACSCLIAADKGYKIGHITMCTGLVNNYPADSVNWFYRKKHKVVQYFCYFLFSSKRDTINLMSQEHLFINPFEIYSGQGEYSDEDSFVFENKWVSPSGKIICEKVLSWNKLDSDKNVTVNDKQYIPYAFANYIGIGTMYSENGQERLPNEKGLYHVDMYVNGELAAVSFFEMKD